MFEQIMEQLRLLAAKALCEEMQQKIRQKTEETLDTLGIIADVTIDIKCNGVDLEQFEKGITELEKQAITNDENDTLLADIKSYKE